MQGLALRIAILSGAGAVAVLIAIGLNTLSVVH